MPFYPDSARPAGEGRDGQGRRYVRSGTPGQPAELQAAVRATLVLDRPGEREVILVTNLLEAAAISAVDLLTAYLSRWGMAPSRASSAAMA